jgi:hypothetical protein
VAGAMILSINGVIPLSTVPIRLHCMDRVNFTVFNLGTGYPVGFKV